MAQDNDAGISPLEGGFGLFPRLVLGVFGKHWTPGETKTRLAAGIGAKAAALASKCFLETNLQRLGIFASRADLLLAATPSEKLAAFEGLEAIHNTAWRVEGQAEGDLGCRMHSFFEQALAKAPAAILVGSDTPHLPIDAVQSAIEWLSEPVDGPRLVLGPTTDGGYWLIGCRGEPAPVFDQMPWSEPELWEETLNRLSTLGWREGTDYRLVAGCYDIDTLDDLNQLRAKLPQADAPLRRLAEQLDSLLGPLS